MSLLLLFVSFFFALYGAWVFFSGYTAGDNLNADMVAAITGMAITIIPYIIARTLAEMVAIRQRHLQLEQALQFNMILAEQMEIAQEAASIAEKDNTQKQEVENSADTANAAADKISDKQESSADKQAAAEPPKDS